jgi:hypothetical protein
VAETKKAKLSPDFCDLTGARTQDPIIKSDVLYQLSYQVGTLEMKSKIVT